MSVRLVELGDLFCNLVYSINGNVITKEYYKDKIGPENYTVLNPNDHVSHATCKIEYAPHNYFIDNNEKFYIDYMTSAGKYAGFGLEHSVNSFKQLIILFKDYSSPLIQCKWVDINGKKRLVIQDGLHRACILLCKFGIKHKIIVAVN